MLATVAASSLLALMITALQLMVEYRRDVAGIDAHFQIVEQSYLPSIEETVWLLDKVRLETLLGGIARLPDFRYAEVSDDRHQRVGTVGDLNAASLMREFTLQRQYRGKTVPMGTLRVGASFEAVEQRLWGRAGLVLAGNAVKTALVATLMLLLIDRLVVRRIGSMAEQASRFGSGQKWQPLISQADARQQEDEISDLGQALDTMSERMEVALSEQRLLNAELERRVEMRTADLVRARDEAERANNAKSEFLSRMSHELRTPMNAILGFGQVLELDPKLDANQRSQVGEILEGGRHLLELINEVLDLASIESGHTQVSIEPVDLRPLLEECEALLRPLTTARGVVLNAAVEDGTTVMADRTRLKQVLLNLLSNAVKYNRENGHVEVWSEASGEGRLRISVRDTGPGIADERLCDLFQAFNRLGAEASAVEGTGIGLVISQRLSQLMNGRLGVSSEVGKGSTFWLDLQAAERVAPMDAAAKLADTACELKILYVVDHPSHRRLAAKLVAMRPHTRMLAAQSASEALRLAQAMLPDLIMLDLDLPGMNGGEMLHLLRQDARLAHVPVVAITGDARPDGAASARAEGFADLLTMPLDVTHFLALVDRLLPA